MSRKHSFFIRLCYGFVSKYKDTSKMTTKEVIEEFLKRNGVKSAKEFFTKKFRQKCRLRDEQLPKSVGAKWNNYEIRMPDGSKAKFVEGTKIQNKEVFAGYGTRIPIKTIDKLNYIYRINSIKWRKVKAEAHIETMGEEIHAEIHWYEEPSVGKVEFKFKREL